MHPHNDTSETHSHAAADWFVESFIGRFVHKATASKKSWYPEENSKWTVPEKYLRTKGKEADSWKQNKQNDNAGGNVNDPERATSRASSETVVGEETNNANSRLEQKKSKKASEKSEKKEQNAERTDSGEGGDPDAEQEQEEEDPNLVTWYGDNDPANPQNWSVPKKCFVTAELCILTFSIYIGSAIYSPGYESLNRTFGINSTVATLGLTLFVVGYGIGPLFLAPLSEIPQIGRMFPYVITLFLFLVLQPITATVQNVAGLMILRFLAGFVGSPVLATGGASLGDMFSPKTRPYAIGIWGMAAVQGPVLGPLLGGFAIMKEDWRWAFWILTWLSGGCLLFLLFCFPETSSANILLRRARRLRARTGNENLRSQGEIESSKIEPKAMIKQTLLMPFVLSFTEPICFALNAYIGLVYSILYVWIESFQLVFVNVYGFNLGENGLAYLGLFVGSVIGYVGFAYYNHKITIPEIRKTDNKLPPERRLPVAMVGSFFLPICIFSFGATSTESIHWIVPIICSSLFGIGTFLLFQAVLNYLQDAYPAKAASILAGNDFFRSMMGAGFPLFATPLFNHFTSAPTRGTKVFPVFWGCILLGCLTLAFVPIPFVLYKYGKKIRQRSKNARQDL